MLEKVWCVYIGYCEMIVWFWLLFVDYLFFVYCRRVYDDWINGNGVERNVRCVYWCDDLNCKRSRRNVWSCIGSFVYNGCEVFWWNVGSEKVSFLLLERIGCLKCLIKNFV